MKTPNRYIVPTQPTHDDVHRLWIQSCDVQIAYNGICRIVKDFAQIGTAPKTLKRLRQARSSAAGAVRAAHNRHVRAQTNFAKARKP